MTVGGIQQRAGPHPTRLAAPLSSTPRPLDGCVLLVVAPGSWCPMLCTPPSVPHPHLSYQTRLAGLAWAVGALSLARVAYPSVLPCSG
jgi:hypothetical protein